MDPIAEHIRDCFDNLPPEKVYANRKKYGVETFSRSEWDCEGRFCNRM